MMISPLPGATPTKPGSATLPLPGIIAKVVNMKNEPVAPGETGYLTIQKPWPSMLRTIYGDDERYAREYWQQDPRRLLRRRRRPVRQGRLHLGARPRGRRD